MKKGIMVFAALLVLGVSAMRADAQWTQVYGSGSRDIERIISHDGAIYAGTGDGILRSTDNGSTWTAFNAGLNQANDGGYPNFSSMTTVGTTLFAVGDRLYKLRAGQPAWEKASVDSFVVSKTVGAGGVLYASGYYFSDGTIRLYRSTNEGASWTVLPFPLGTDQYLASFTADGTTLLVVRYDFISYLNFSFTLHRSTDSGATWNDISGGLSSNTYYTIIFQQGAKAFLYNGSSYSLSVSSDTGSTFTATSGLSAYIPQQIAFNGAFFFGKSDYDIISRSTDGGFNWEQTLLGDNVSGAVAASGSDVYAGSYGRGIFRTTDSGTNWTQAIEGLTGPSDANAFAANGTTILAGTNDGVFRTTNAGQKWSDTNLRESISILESQGTLALASGDIYNYTAAKSAALGGLPPPDTLYRSTDDGQTWSKGTLVSVRHIVMNGAAILAFAGSPYDNFQDSLYRSTDNGQTWLPLPNSPTAFSGMSDLLAYNGDIFAATSTGLYRSTNNGDTWALSSNGLPLVFDENDSIPASVSLLGKSSTSLLAVSGNLLYLSTDTGDNWTFTGVEAEGIAAIASEGNTVALSVFSSSGEGKKWAKMTTAQTVPERLTELRQRRERSTINAALPFGDRAFAKQAASQRGSTTDKAKAAGSVIDRQRQGRAMNAIGTEVFFDEGIYFSPDAGVRWYDTGFDGYTSSALHISNGFVFTTFNSDIAQFPLVQLPKLTGWIFRDLGIDNQFLTGVSANDSVALIVSPNANYIYSSTDGGETWFNNYVSNANELRGVAIAGDYNPNNAAKGNVASGVQGFGSAVAVGVGGTILRSGDGGSNWGLISSGTTSDLNAVAATAGTNISKGNSASGTRGFGSAVAVGVGGTILRSADGGTSWSLATIGTAALNSIALADDFNASVAAKGNAVSGVQGFGSAVAVGVGGTILRTDNGGQNWQSVASNTSNDLNAVSYFGASQVSKSNTASGTNGFGSAVAVGVGGTILRSDNSGGAWTTITGVTLANLLAVKMIDADTIYIAGEKGALFKTTNGGTNWIDQSVPTLEDITAITFAPNGQGYAIGTNSVVLTTSSGGNITLSAADGNVAGLPKEFILKQNYPNPFNPSTTIRYELPQQSDVKLKIYDMLGREVESLVSERQPAGTYTVRFNGSRLSSGMYFYRLQTGSTVQTKKMLLVK